MIKSGPSLVFLAAIVFSLAAVSCVSSDVEYEYFTEEKISRNIADKGVCSAKVLEEFFMDHNPGAKRKFVHKMAKLYVREAKIEGINSDAAFVQMCLETGFLRYGNLVTPDMNNFCGLGAIDADHPGERFKTPALGVRAHIQHLHAYGTSGDVALKNQCIDRRYKYVNPRGKAPTVYDLSGTWAADRSYGDKLDNLLRNLETYLR